MMLESLITSKARVKLLLKFFLNPESRGYLRELAKEFGESTNNIRIELNRLTQAKLLIAETVGRTVLYRANIHHTLFPDIQRVVQKQVGIDRLVEDLVTQLGDLKAAFIVGDYARGIDSGIIDLVLVGRVKEEVLLRLIAKTGKIISRKIRSLVVTAAELDQLRDQLDIAHALPIWEAEPAASE